MVKEKLGRIIRRIFYVVFALLISVGLWIYVEITENELQIREIPNIEVVLRHEDILGDRNFFIEGEMPAISFTVEASRSDIAALLVPGAVTVEIDLINVISAGTTSLSYEIANWPPRVNRNVILDWSARRIPLTIGIHGQKSVPVLVEEATAADGFITMPPEFDPQVISISGPEDIIASIDHVHVPVNRENLTATITEYLEFLLFDENGDEIIMDDDEWELISFSQDIIRVTIPVNIRLEIPLLVSFAYGNSTADYNVTYEITPNYLLLAGDAENMRDLNSIPLGTIDLSRHTTLSFTEEFPIIVPDSIRNLSGDMRATVSVRITGLEIQSRNVSNFQGINVPDGLAYEIQTRVQPITIRGTQEDLADITELNFAVTVDLEDMELGTSWVLATVQLHGIDGAVDVVGEYRLAVRIFDPLTEPIATEP